MEGDGGVLGGREGLGIAIVNSVVSRGFTER